MFNVGCLVNLGLVQRFLLEQLFSEGFQAPLILPQHYPCPFVSLVNKGPDFLGHGVEHALGDPCRTGVTFFGQHLYRANPL